MASAGKPRSYMIRSIQSWLVVLKAEVKSTIRAYMSLRKSLASSSAITTFWSRWMVSLCLQKPACVVLSTERVSASLRLCVSACSYRVLVMRRVQSL